MRPILEPKYDTGRSNSDNITNIAVPAPTPGVTPNFVPPVFDVNTVAPRPGQPAIATVELFRSTTADRPVHPGGDDRLHRQPGHGDRRQPRGAAPRPVRSTRPSITRPTRSTRPASRAASRPRWRSWSTRSRRRRLPAPTLDPASNTGLVKSQNITNVTNPTFDATNLLPGEQLFLYRSSNGKPAILVGTGPINNTSAAISATVTDTAGAVPDGVYQYYRRPAGHRRQHQQLQPGRRGDDQHHDPRQADHRPPGVRRHGPAVAPQRHQRQHAALRRHRAVQRRDQLPGRHRQRRDGRPCSATTYPAANGTYLAQITSPLADGVYTLVARTTNQAGNFSYSAPLTITIKHTGPQIAPTLSILPADDTGIKGDGVTANHSPRFTGTTDPGDTVTLYVLINGVLSAPPGHDHLVHDQRVVHLPAAVRPDRRDDPARRPDQRHRQQQGPAQPALDGPDHHRRRRLPRHRGRPAHRLPARPTRPTRPGTSGPCRSTPRPAATSRSSTTSTATA